MLQMVETQNKDYYKIMLGKATFLFVSSTKTVPSMINFIERLNKYPSYKF